MSRLTWHAVYSRTWAARLAKRWIWSAGAFHFPVLLHRIVAAALLPAVLLMKGLGLTGKPRLRTTEYIWHATESATASRLLLIFCRLSRSRATVTSSTSGTEGIVSGGHSVLTKPTHIGWRRRLLIGRLWRHSITLMRLSIHSTLTSKRSSIALVRIAELSRFIRKGSSSLSIAIGKMPKSWTYLVYVCSIVRARVIWMSIRVASRACSLALMLLWHVLGLLGWRVLLAGYAGVGCRVAACLRFGNLSITRLWLLGLTCRILRRYFRRRDTKSTSRSLLRSSGILLALLRLLAVRSIVVLISVALLI